MLNIKLVAICLASIFLGLPVSALASDNLLNTIQAQNQLYMDAYRSDNAVAIVALHTQDATVIAPKFNPATGHDEIRSGLIEELALGDGTLKLQAIEVTRLNKNTAYEIGQYKLHIDLPDGEVIEEEGNTLLIWKLGEDNIWRIHVDLWNSNHPDR